MRRAPSVVALAAVALAACGDQQLVIELWSTTSGRFGQPVQVSVIDADGSNLDVGEVALRMTVPIHAGAQLHIGEDRSSSPSAPGYQTTIYLALSPGDVVRHNGGRPPDISVLDQYLSMSFVPPPLPPGGVSVTYGAYTPCGGVEFYSPPTLSFPPDCTPPRFDLVIYAYDPGFGLQVAVQPDVELVDRGRITITSPWQPAATTPVTVHGIPADATSVVIGRIYAGASAGGRELITADAAVTGSDATAVLPALGRAGLLQAVAVTVTRSGIAGDQRHVFTISGDPGAYDRTPYPFPWITRAPLPGDRTLALSDGGAIDLMVVNQTPQSSTSSQRIVAPGSVPALPLIDRPDRRHTVLTRCPTPASYRDILYRGGACPFATDAGQVTITSSLTEP